MALHSQGGWPESGCSHPGRSSPPSHRAQLQRHGAKEAGRPGAVESSARRRRVALAFRRDGRNWCQQRGSRAMFGALRKEARWPTSARAETTRPAWVSEGKPEVSPDLDRPRPDRPYTVSRQPSSMVSVKPSMIGPPGVRKSVKFNQPDRCSAMLGEDYALSAVKRESLTATGRMIVKPGGPAPSEPASTPLRILPVQSSGAVSRVPRKTVTRSPASSRRPHPIIAASCNVYWLVTHSGREARLRDESVGTLSVPNRRPAWRVPVPAVLSDRPAANHDHGHYLRCEGTAAEVPAITPWAATEENRFPAVIPTSCLDVEVLICQPSPCSWLSSPK